MEKVSPSIRFKKSCIAMCASFGIEQDNCFFYVTDICRMGRVTLSVRGWTHSQSTIAPQNMVRLPREL